VREQVPADTMTRVAGVRYVVKTSPNRVIPEIKLQRPGAML
jgi:uncharacterized protein YlzI (FlbEa/FlbD family)